MDSVEALVAHVQALSGNPEDVSHLHSLLKQSEESLQSQASRLVPFLEQLGPSKPSLGYLYLLEAYLSGSILREQPNESLLSVVNFINSCSTEQPYIDLANSYSTGRFSELEASIQTNVEKFQNGSNLGLAKQVLSSLYKHNIQRLTQTYLTLSLQDIATTVQLMTSKEAEMHVLRMIQEGEIFATINQKHGMVSFHEDSEQYKTCEMIERIDSSIQRIITLSKKLNWIDEHISCDPAYLTKVRERPRYDFDNFDSVPHKFLL